MAAILLLGLLVGRGAVQAVWDGLDRILNGTQSEVPVPPVVPGSTGVISEYDTDRLDYLTNGVYIDPPDEVRLAFGDLPIRLLQPNLIGGQGYSYIGAGEFGTRCFVGIAAGEGVTRPGRYDFVVESRFADSPYYQEILADARADEEVAAWLEEQWGSCNAG